MQDGSLYAIGDTCYLKYYIITDGKRVHKTIQLCKRMMSTTGGRSEGSGDTLQPSANSNARRWTRLRPTRRPLNLQPSHSPRKPRQGRCVSSISGNSTTCRTSKPLSH